MTGHDLAVLVSTAVSMGVAAFSGLGWMLKLVHDIRNDLRAMNGRLVRVEQWQLDHMREMDRRLGIVERRMESCVICQATNKSD